MLSTATHQYHTHLDVVVDAIASLRNGLQQPRIVTVPKAKGVDADLLTRDRQTRTLAAHGCDNRDSISGPVHIAAAGCMNLSLVAL